MRLLVVRVRSRWLQRSPLTEWRHNARFVFGVSRSGVCRIVLYSFGNRDLLPESRQTHRHTVHPARPHKHAGYLLPAALPFYSLSPAPAFLHILYPRAIRLIAVKAAPFRFSRIYPIRFPAAKVMPFRFSCICRIRLAAVKAMLFRFSRICPIRFAASKVMPFRFSCICPIRLAAAKAAPLRFPRICAIQLTSPNAKAAPHSFRASLSATCRHAVYPHHTTNWL